MKTSQLFVHVLLFALIILAGCEALSEQEWQEEYPESCDEELLQNLRDVPRLHLDHPINDPQPWETNVSVLRDSIAAQDRKSTRLNSSHVAISYAVFCLKKKI